MHVLTRSHLSRAAVLFALPLLCSAGGRAISITSCQTIQQSGNYHLVQDIATDVAGATCIEVLASDVELHLDGFTIRSANAGIRVNAAHNVSITGSGTIEAALGIIAFGGASGTKIVNVTIRADASYAVHLNHATDAVIVGNTLISSATGVGSTGVHIFLSNDNIVRANKVSGFTYGITLVASSGNLVQANTVSTLLYDLRDVSTCGANTWKANTYTTFLNQCNP